MESLGLFQLNQKLVQVQNGDLKPYKKIPIMVLFGDYVDLSPRWAPCLKACREFAQKTNEQGGKVDLLLLPEVGIKGNSHMLMQDTNSIEIANIVGSWIEQIRKITLSEQDIGI
jgi:hypothetical protein